MGGRGVGGGTAGWGAGRLIGLGGCGGDGVTGGGVRGATGRAGAARRVGGVGGGGAVVTVRAVAASASGAAAGAGVGGGVGVPVRGWAWEAGLVGIGGEAGARVLAALRGLHGGRAGLGRVRWGGSGRGRGGGSGAVRAGGGGGACRASAGVARHRLTGGGGGVHGPEGGEPGLDIVGSTCGARDWGRGSAGWRASLPLAAPGSRRVAWRGRPEGARGVGPAQRVGVVACGAALQAEPGGGRWRWARQCGAGGVGESGGWVGRSGGGVPPTDGSSAGSAGGGREIACAGCRRVSPRAQA